PEATGPAVLTPGCHSITLATSHAFQSLGVLPVREGDVDSLVWWVYVPPGLFQGGAVGAAGQGGAAGEAGGLPGGAAGAAGTGGTGGSTDSFESCLRVGSPL
ncbi:MAG TPA: hypothetical protein VFS00_26705, partial [Polyangiaceae bacterium]|nr:hypothetical protein [Polyangiaceae bacterium]